MYAYDFNRVPGPSADEIKANDGAGVLTYGTGTQQDPQYLADLDAAGLKTPLIWEHNVDSILGGYQYGADECRAWEASHPAGELVYLACDLNDGALAGRTPQLLDTCRGWCDTTREAAVGLYGPDDAILAAQQSGIVKLSRWWGVVNWLNGGYADNDPRNIARWTEIGAHLVQLIGSPIPDTDQNLILRDDWWSTGAAPSATHPLLVLLEEDVHFETDPANRADIWRFDGNTRAHLTPDEWAIEKAKYAFTLAIAGLPAGELKPFAGTPATFASTPDIQTLVDVAASGTGGVPAPTHFTITGDAQAA